MMELIPETRKFATRLKKLFFFPVIELNEHRPIIK